MITIRKLSSLETGTMVRKSVRLLESALKMVRSGKSFDSQYFSTVCRLLALNSFKPLSQPTRKNCESVAVLFEDSSKDHNSLVWPLSDLVHRLHTDLHIDRADWDFTQSNSDRLDSEVRSVYPVTVVLDRLRSPFNVGSIFRTSESFGVESIILVEPSASPTHPRAQRSGRGCTDSIPWKTLLPTEIAPLCSNQPVFALELGGASCNEFSFPKEGVVVLGSEELGVSPEMLALADASLGRVSIPLMGSKGSLNVSVAFGILMYLWSSQIANTQ